MVADLHDVAALFAHYGLLDELQAIAGHHALPPVAVSNHALVHGV